LHFFLDALAGVDQSGQNDLKEGAMTPIDYVFWFGFVSGALCCFFLLFSFALFGGIRHAKDDYRD
jgi:hypothetical protein